jgi:predicted ATPase
VAKGRTIAEIRADMVYCTGQVMDRQRQVEDGLPAGDLLFVDRGLPDCFAFFRLAGVDPNDYLAACFHHQYAGVFLLDPLEFERDGTRMENDAIIAPYLEAWHTRDYLAMGYDVVRVPVLPPPERLAYVLERVAE